MKLSDLFEQGGVGVVAKNAKQAKDPRYSMSMTVDVNPGETEKQAAKFGNKLNKDGRPPLLGEDAATNLKSTIVSLVKQTDDAKVLAKVLNTLKSSDLPDKLKNAFSQDVDASKMIDKLANTIVNMEGTAEEKIAFADNYTKGFVDVSKLLDGNLHSFEEIIPDRFALEVFKLFAINLTAQGVGPGEVALSILSPKINHLGRASGGGDIRVDGKAIEVKTKVSNGGRWVDARKAKLNMNEIKKTIQEKTGIDIGGRMGIARWIDEIRPLAKNPKDLADMAKTIAKGNFAFVDTSKIEKALKTGSAEEIKDTWTSTGFDNYKAYSKFDGMLLMDAGKQWSAQYFNDYDSMRNNVSVKTVYMYGPESEAMPQVELISGKAAAAAAAATSSSAPGPAPTTDVKTPSRGERAKRSTWHKAYKDQPPTTGAGRKKRD